MFDRTASHEPFTRAISSTGRTRSLEVALSRTPSHTAKATLDLDAPPPTLPTIKSVTDDGSTNSLEFMKAHEEAKALAYAKKKKFWWFALIASLNHALSYVVIAYATSVLSPSLGGTILGLSWLLNAVSGLTVATPLVRGMGFKYSMILSLAGYTIQLSTLYWAVVSTDIYLSWAVAIAGNVVSGFTSAVWWTSQGVYFEAVCQELDHIFLLADPNNTPTIDAIRADISAHWTIIYQMADVAVFLTLSVFPYVLGCGVHPVLCALLFVGVATTALGFTFEDLPADQGQISSAQIYQAVVAVPKQIRDDARVSLLTPFVFGFGITTAMFAYYVNGDVVSGGALGEVALGFLEAWSYFVAIVSAFPYAYVSNHYASGQDWVIQFGSLAFGLSGFVVLVLTTDQLGNWGVMLLIKGLYGLGRGVFEGSCRAVYASMFKGNDLSTAFSAQTLSAGFSGGICFFLFGVMTRQIIAGVTIFNAVMALVAYFVLMYAVDRKQVLPWSRLCGCGAQRDSGATEALLASESGTSKIGLLDGQQVNKY